MASLPRLSWKRLALEECVSTTSQFLLGANGEATQARAGVEIEVVADSGKREAWGLSAPIANLGHMSPSTRVKNLVLNKEPGRVEQLGRNEFI